MYWNKTAADIAQAWQGEIDSQLETGATAVLLGGAPDALLASATTLLALQNSTRQRVDVATPLLVVGGNSALWLGLLMSAQPNPRAQSAPAPTVIYGGGDPATYLAMTSLMTTRATAAFGTGSLGLGSQFAPHLQPGAAAAWEMLPLLEIGEQPVAGAHIAPPPDSGPLRDPTGDWIAWGVMLLAVCLVLSALLI